jgi:carbamoyl-phosphate synthase small subunit
VLADGSIYEGELIGAEMPVATGEVVFNTVLTGYQEVLTDPSYAGQIITFTTPHIGNYGVNATDFESRGAFCRGVIMRDLARRHSSHRAEGDLDSMLRDQGVPGITGIDTRRLTRAIPRRERCPGRSAAPPSATSPQPRPPNLAPTVSTSSARSRHPSRTASRRTTRRVGC